MSFMKLFDIEYLYLLKPRGSCENTQLTITTKLIKGKMYKEILLENKKLSAYINIQYQRKNKSKFSSYAQLFFRETFAKYNLLKKMKRNELNIEDIVEDIVKELSM